MKKVKMQEVKLISTIFVMAIAIMLFFYSFHSSTDVNFFSYQINQTIDYRVYLIDNPYITQNYLPKEKNYIQRLVDYIPIYFTYTYSQHYTESTKLQYDVTTTLVIDYANTRENIFQRIEPVIENKSIELKEQNQITIRENVSIDYKKYESEVTRFKEELNLPIKAYLKVNFTIKAEANLQKPFSPISSMELIIPLSESVFSITTNQTDNQEDIVLDTSNFLKNINIPFFIISILLFIVFGICLSFQVKKYQLLKTTKSKIKLNRTIRRYRNIMIEVEKDFSLKEEKTILAIKNFYELLMIEEELRIPILFFYPNAQEAIFMIISQDVVYQYHWKINE